MDPVGRIVNERGCDPFRCGQHTISVSPSGGCAATIYEDEEDRQLLKGGSQVRETPDLREELLDSLVRKHVQEIPRIRCQHGSAIRLSPYLLFTLTFFVCLL